MISLLVRTGTALAAPSAASLRYAPRTSLDRHATYIVAAYLTGAAR